MKADFRMLYNLSNRSGWGWDDHLHLPIAIDDVWDEIYKECPRMRRFRNNPFTLYETFETICGANTATGSSARSYKSVESRQSNTISDRMECSEAPEYADDFFSMHGVSYIDLDPELEMLNNENMTHSFQIGSKCSSGEKLQIRCKLKVAKKSDMLTELINANTTNITIMTNSMNQRFPHTMDDCIKKFKSMPNLSVAAIMLVQEEIMHNLESRDVLMLWEDEILFEWIERTVALHPKYCSHSPWHSQN